MMIRKSSLIKFIRKKKTKKSVVDRINKRAVEYLADFLNNEIEYIIAEAHNSKCQTLLPIDMERGIKKWLNKVLTDIKNTYIIE